MTTRPPSVTIVICARNAAKHLRRSILSALAQDYPRERFKILVVDNGSTDGTAAVARELGATVRGHRKPGI
ncbi:MAG: glycosyltransferase, partial [Candidatus Sumerlaeota bacterium]